MQVTGKPRAAEQAGIQQGCVVKAILQHAIALPHQRGDRTEIGHITGGKQQRARASGELGQCFFELVMWGAMADHQMRGTAAHTPFLRASAPGFDHLRMIGQAEVVIGTEGQQLPTIDLHQRPLR